MKKILITIGLLVLAALGLWWSGLLNDYIPSIQTLMQPEQEEPQAQAPTPTQPQSDLPTNSGDTSDAALVQDSAAVDMQLQALAEDQAAADESANDKPIAQEF